MENHEQNLEPTPAQPADSYRRALLGTVIRYEGLPLGLHHAAHGDALHRASGLFDLTADGELQTDAGQTVRDFLSDLRKRPDGQHLFAVGAPRPTRQVRGLTPRERLDLENTRTKAVL